MNKTSNNSCNKLEDIINLYSIRNFKNFLKLSMFLLMMHLVSIWQTIMWASLNNMLEIKYLCSKIQIHITKFINKREQILEANYFKAWEDRGPKVVVPKNLIGSQR